MWQLVLLLFANVLTTVISEELVVATYNLWNIMYHWEVRKLYIAEMIQNSDIDIIGFQEVRAHKDLQHTQLDELQHLLPIYQHKLFIPLNYINTKYSMPDGWEWEGMGFLSKHKVLTNGSMALNNLPYSPDKTKRVVLYAQFQMESSGKEVNVIFNHFSYNKRQQCSNAHQLLELLFDLGIENTILLGDFNIFENFEEPSDALIDGYFKDDGQCIGNGFNETQSLVDNYSFIDAWFKINPNHPGYTFSNMPNPGFINRPDRIFISKVGLNLKSILLRGKGALYRQKYKNKLWWARFWSVYNIMKEKAEGKNYERSCLWDCGPHGSCRCGICITGGDQNNCRLSECHECSPTKISMLNIITLLCLPCFASIIMSFILLIFGIMRPRLRRVCVNRLRLGKFIDKYTVIFSFLFLFILFKILMYEYSDIFTLISLQLYEELFPSDHLMVIATVDII